MKSLSEGSKKLVLFYEIFYRKDPDFSREDVEVLDKLYRGDKIMDNVQREMKGLVEEVDGILYYDEAKLQKAIEKEMAEKGYKEGHKEGLKQGRVEVAKSLLTMGVLSIEQISDVTGLSINEIEKLKES